MDQPKCGKCQDKGFFPPTTKFVKLCSCKREVDSLDAAAEVLLDHVRGLDPTYAARIQAKIDEQHLTAYQVLGAFCGYVLDNSLHMQLPQHPLFRQGATPTPLRQRCAYAGCNKTFAAQWPGQRYCSFVCTQRDRRLPPVVDEPLTETDPAQLVD